MTETHADYCDRIRATPAPAPNPTIIIPCSGRKLDQRAHAAKLYTGTLHKAARRAADTLIREPGHTVWLILSAKHGLVEPHTPLDPYNCTWGDPDAISSADLAAQCRALWDDKDRTVVALMPAAYCDQLKAAMPGNVLVRTPLRHKGIGQQLGFLKELAERTPLDPPMVPTPAPIIPDTTDIHELTLF